ncbi:surface protein, partial [Reticulomyxa filosa]
NKSCQKQNNFDQNLSINLKFRLLFVIDTNTKRKLDLQVLRFFKKKLITNKTSGKISHSSDNCFTKIKSKFVMLNAIFPFLKKNNLSGISSMQLETTKKAEGERAPEDVLKDFLEKNKVKKSNDVAEKFSQIEVTLEDLMQYREKEIEDICAEAGISMVSKADLCKVLRSTPDSYAYKEAQRTKVVLPPLILQASEQEKLDAIYEKVKKVSEKVMAIDKEVEQMERESQEKKKEINEKFEEMISNMTKHKEKIINELEEIKNKKINEMKKMREELVKKEKEMKEWNEKWNEAMSDPNTDIY